MLAYDTDIESFSEAIQQGRGPPTSQAGERGGAVEVATSSPAG